MGEKNRYGYIVYNPHNIAPHDIILYTTHTT